MKKSNIMKMIQKTLMLTAVFSLVFSSCKKDPEEIGPPAPPEIGATATIAELTKAYTDAGSPDIFNIDSETVIEGVVSSSDETGNHYKAIYIQDETGGIVVKLNKTNLYSDYSIGQTVFVKCQGLKMGNYGGLIQLGGLYNGNVGNIEEDQIANHLVAGELGEAPTAFNLDLDNIPTDINTKYSTWVSIDDVMFSDADKDKVFADNTVDAKKSGNRTLTTVNGGTIIVRTSGYSTFADTQLPTMSGSISGVLTVFNGTLQLMLNTDDDINFTAERFVDPNGTAPAAGTGTLADPYNISAAKANQDVAEEKWVKGYIVGSISDFVYYFNAETTSVSNIILADIVDETNEAKVLPVQLPSGFVRDGVSLANVPENLGKAIWLKGKLTAYFSREGLKEVSSYSWDGVNEETPVASGIIGEGEAIPGSDLTNTTIDFRTYNVIQSEAIWAASNSKASVNAYGKGATESWMISTNTVDLTGANEVLVVTEEMNYFTSIDDVKVLYSTDYTGTGDPSSATWTEFIVDETIIGPRTNSALSTTPFQAVSESAAYIAFKYSATATASMLWVVKTVEVKDPSSLVPPPSLPTTIQNGDFEGTWTDDNTPDGWDKAENITKESTTVHTGSFSAKHVGGTKDLAQMIAAEEGATYEVSFWYYIESGDGTDGRLWSFFKDDTNASIGDIKDANDYLTGANGTWHEYKAEYVAPAGTTKIFFELRTYGSAVVYYDDIAIVKK